MWQWRRGEVGQIEEVGAKCEGMPKNCNLRPVARCRKTTWSLRESVDSGGWMSRKEKDRKKKDFWQWRLRLTIVGRLKSRRDAGCNEVRLLGRRCGCAMELDPAQGKDGGKDGRTVCRS